MGDGQGDDLIAAGLGNPARYGCAVELVQLAGKGGKVAAACIAALHQEGQQGIAGGGFPGQRQNEVDRNAVMLEAVILYKIDEDPVPSLGADQVHCHCVTLLGSGPIEMPHSHFEIFTVKNHGKL